MLFGHSSSSHNDNPPLFLSSLLIKRAAPSSSWLVAPFSSSCGRSLRSSPIVVQIGPFFALRRYWLLFFLLPSLKIGKEFSRGGETAVGSRPPWGCL